MQVSLGRANLFLNEVEVVEEPFACGRNPSVSFYGLCQKFTNVKEDAFILTETRQQLLGGMTVLNVCVPARALPCCSI